MPHELELCAKPLLHCPSELLPLEEWYTCPSQPLSISACQSTLKFRCIPDSLGAQPTAESVAHRWDEWL